jgi:4-amino-4-deoxy-L-arabinose transferase-like glycosyltransferase
MQPVPALRLSVADWLVCAGLVVWAMVRMLPGLDHPGLPRWDEAIHQAAARGVFDEPLRPHIFSDHLYYHPASNWWFAGVWLHKPPLPFWAAAFLMHFTGIRPLALRLVSVFADVAVALGLFFLMRRAVGRALSALAGFAYLSLPFTWVLTQGYFFGDATDTSLAACLVLSVLALVRTVDRSSLRWAAVTGAMLGLGYLCKSALALEPLGIAAGFYLLGRKRIARGLDAPALVTLAGTLVLVAAPWTAYSAWQWPRQYQANAQLIYAHLVAELSPWGRPIDAIFNEINATELLPIPVACTLLAALWMAWRAWTSRRTLDIALALWIWPSWLVLSLTPSKVPAHAFGVVPAVLAAIVALISDARRRPVLAAASLAGLMAGVLVPRLPALSTVRRLIPASLPQTRAQPGLAEGLLLILLAAATAWLVVRLLRNPSWLRVAMGSAGLAGALGLLAIAPPLVRQDQEAQRVLEMGVIDYSREVGRALDLVTPKRSVIFANVDREPECCTQQHALIFYSGRMTYLIAYDLETAAEHGYAPYLVSPLAEPFAPIGIVPAHAWLRAYDLSAPTDAPAPLPSDATPLALRAGTLDLLGIACGPAVDDIDHWVLFAQMAGEPKAASVSLVFRTRYGVVPVTASTEATMAGPAKLAKAAWFVLPFIGPRRADVLSLGLKDGRPLALPPLPR